MLIYEMALRVRLFMASKQVNESIADLKPREILILELLSAKERMNISEIAKLYPTVSHSTVSTTITKLWKDKLVTKTILSENQRITVVNLTDKGKNVLDEIKKSQCETFKTVSQALGLTSERNEFFQLFIENAITYFDKKLSL